MNDQQQPNEPEGMAQRPLLSAGLGVDPKGNKVQMHVDLNAAYSVLIGLTYKLDLQAFNARLLEGRTFLSRMVDQSDYPPC